MAAVVGSNDMICRTLSKKKLKNMEACEAHFHYPPRATMAPSMTTAALALILGAKGQGLYISAIALQALVFFLVNVGVLQATVSQVAAAASRNNEYKSSGWIAFLAKTVAVFGVIIFVIGWFVLPWIGEVVYKDPTVGLWAWWLCAMPLIELPRVVAGAAFQGTRRMLALGQLDNACDFCRFFLVVCSTTL